MIFSVTVVLSQPSTQLSPHERTNTFAVFGGMGVSAVAASEAVEYINAIALFSQRVDDITTAVDFFGGIEFPIADEWGLKFEHAMLFKSYSVLGLTGGTYELYYSIQSPSVLLQRIITGKGYFIKFGAGGGYRIGFLSQRVSTFGVVTEYTSRGWGVKGETVAQTAFSEDFFGYISGTLGWDTGSVLKDGNGKQLTPVNSSATVSLGNISAGIRFGVIQYF